MLRKENVLKPRLKRQSVILLLNLEKEIEEFLKSVLISYIL